MNFNLPERKTSAEICLSALHLETGCCVDIEEQDLLCQLHKLNELENETHQLFSYSVKLKVNTFFWKTVKL